MGEDNKRTNEVPGEAASAPSQRERREALACLQLDSRTPDELQKELARMEYRYATTGLVVGVIAILGGILLFLNGVFGSTNWTARIFGAESTLTDAAPGAVLFIIGFFVVVATRPRVRHLDFTRRRRR